MFFIFLFLQKMATNKKKTKRYHIIIAIIFLMLSIWVPLILLAVAMKLIYYVLFVL